jgi:hypothetical protein
MDLNKIAARVAVELKSAGYLAELIHSALTILAEAGAIPASANNPRLATALEVVLQSELFDVLLLRLLHDRKPPNVPGAGTPSWPSNFGSPPATAAGGQPKIN